jgi:hypothetical protein
LQSMRCVDRCAPWLLEALVGVLALGLNGALQRILGDDEGLVGFDARIESMRGSLLAYDGSEEAVACRTTARRRLSLGLFCVVKALGGGDDALVQSSRLAEEETMREGSTTE